METADNSTVDALQNEIQFYRQNQLVVEQEVRALIADNQKLSQQVGSLLKEKLQNAQQAHDYNRTEEVEELKKQISLLTKERDSLNVLWQTSQKTIEALDIELKTYQSYNRREGNKNKNPDHFKRDFEIKLETALADYVELESNYKKVNTERNSIETELKNKGKEIATLQEQHKELKVELAELKKTLDEYKVNLSAEIKSNENIKLQLIACQKECVDKIKNETEAKSKVAEALQLYDLVSIQKNEAYKKISEITGELTRVKQALANIQRETEANYRIQLDEIKEKYNEKVSDMLAHIRNLDAELVEKGVLLNKALRENKILLTANENYLKQQENDKNIVDPKLALAEQRLEAMFQELVSSERRNIQLVCEKQCLTMDIQRIQDTHTRECKRRDWEENLMKTQIEELKLHVDHLQKSLEETHGMINKLQSMLSSRTELSQKMVSTKEEELMELNKHLENQMELNKKWKESYVDMTEKLKKKLEALNNENRELRKQLNLPYIGTSCESSNSSS